MIVTSKRSSNTIADATGAVAAWMRYYPWGEKRYANGTLNTTFRYTGQRQEDYIKLIQMGSRWYDSELGRFISPDPIIPEPYNPLAYDRYQYVYSNPVRYTDSSGHCIDGITTWVCVGVAVGVVSKVVDYGWTAYDAWKSGQVLNDPNASQAAKDEAAANLAMAATFEGLEPDDLLPISLPLDDLARHGILGAAKQLPLPGFENYVDDAATQIHHLISDKHSYWTGVMREITDKYKLDLGGSWNKIPLTGHSGKHTDQYHQWTYDQLVEIDGLAKGNTNEFLRLFDERIKGPVLKNPSLPYRK